ncbi:MAG TPA: type II toxin-antitoxin system RelE/ParE family toxin [Armatimonadota bacterium]|jgi:phage-related protein
MGEKDLIILEGEIKTPPFSSEARVEAGVLIRRIQQGEALSMPHSRPMPGIGQGCHELRITDETVSWRIAYFVDGDAIVILDVWPKKTLKTPPQVIRNCQRRLRQYQSARYGKGEGNGPK